MVVQVTDANFDQFILQNPYAVICFYDKINGPSKFMLPILYEIADEYKDIIYVGLYDVYKAGNEKERARNNITAIPTFLFYKNGEVINKHIGICSAAQLKTNFEETLA